MPAKCYDSSDMKTILFADSDKSLCSLAKNLWKEKIKIGQFIRIYDGLTFLDYLKKWGKYNKDNAPKPDLIILNYDIKEMSGYELLDEIKHDQDLNDIPLVVTVSGASKDTLTSLRKYKVDYVISVPKSSEDLERILGKLADQFLSSD